MLVTLLTLILTVSGGMQTMMLTNSSVPGESSSSSPVLRWSVLKPPTLQLFFCSSEQMSPLSSSALSLSTTCLCWGWRSHHYCVSVSPAIFYVLFLALTLQNVFTQAPMLLWDELLCNGVDWVCMWEEVDSVSFYTAVLDPPVFLEIFQNFLLVYVVD